MQLSDDSTKNLSKYNPQTPVLNNYSYYLSLRKIKLKQAREMMKTYVSLVPNQPSYEDTYAWIFYQMGDYDKALVWIKKSLENGGSTSPTIVEHYGDILYHDERRKH